MWYASHIKVRHINTDVLEHILSVYSDILGANSLKHQFKFAPNLIVKNTTSTLVQFKPNFALILAGQWQKYCFHNFQNESNSQYKCSRI